MKTTRINLMVLLLLPLLGRGPGACADEPVTNRLSLSARLGFNVVARFKGVAGAPLSLPAAPRRTPSQPGRPDGDPYNYDNGYVLTDISGNEGGLTWYWGYDDAGSQLNSTTLNGERFNTAFPDNTILLSRTTATGGGGSTRDLQDDPILGGELTYNRLLGVRGDARYGVEAAVNYLNVSMRDTARFTGSATRLTDAYPFTPGTTPPDTAAGPYQGSYQGPGFVIGDTPVASASAVVPSAVITDRRRFEGDLWGARLGPYLEVPLGDPMNLSLSAGLAVGLLDASASWAQTAGSARLAGSGEDCTVLWGWYASAAVTWYLSERWSLAGGAQFQSLGDYEHSFGGRRVEVDLSNSWFVTLGLSYKF